MSYATFDALQYAAANPDLARAYGYDRGALYWHYVHRGQAEGRQLSGFDWLSYASANPDLARTFGDDAYRLTLHFVTRGAREGRPLSGFDALQYAAANPGLATTIGFDPDALELHYVQTGARQGLRTSGFDWLSYAASNPDVARTYGLDAVGIIRHYVEHGIAEGLPTHGFNPVQYAAVNPDLARAYGLNPSALARHYLEFGADEGRVVSGFDWLSYASANPDLARSFGANPNGLIVHYVTKGAREGRVLTGFEPLHYAATNPGLVSTIGLDQAALELHYVQTGARQGLRPSGFDSVAYLLSNEDLMAAGFSANLAFSHWLQSGIREGRGGDQLFGREQAGHAVNVNTRIAGALDWVGDRDWYAVNLVAGQSYVVALRGAGSGDGTLLDGSLSIHDSLGRVVAGDLGIGPGRDGFAAFVAPQDGQYYLVARSGLISSSGTYQLEVASSTLLAEDAADNEANGSLFASETDPSAWAVTSLEGTPMPATGPSGGSGSLTLRGTFGTLTLQSDGVWTYVLDNQDPDTQRLLSSEPGVDAFEYQSSDGNNTRTVTLSIVVAGAADVGQVDNIFSSGTALTPFSVRQFTTAVTDFNHDGRLEPFGYLSNPDGSFSLNAQVAAILAGYPGRAHRDARIADFDGDGNLDAILNVYVTPTDARSFGLILYGDGAGGVSRVVERTDVRGFGETIVTADFDNDGDLDVFIPVYTHAGASPANYLLFNDGAGNFSQNMALEYGVGLPGQPHQFRVEGAQAADINFDGLIDLFTASHLFINRGLFFDKQRLDEMNFDEGSMLFDYDNDGDFDLVLADQVRGPKLYEWDGEHFVSRGFMAEGSFYPNVSLNVYDIDGNGWEDVVTRTFPSGMAIFLNFEGHFVRTDMASLHVDSIAFGDINQDRRIDLLARTDQQDEVTIFENMMDVGDTLSISVLGANGEQNQQGRVLTLAPLSRPDIVMARAVDSGSGYMNQNQYELLVGLPLLDTYEVKVYFADRVLTFEAEAGQSIRAFADGRVEIVGTDGVDRIVASSGADIIEGGAGSDLLEGGAGADVFRHSDAQSSLTGAADIIRDFSVAEGDRIDLSELAAGQPFSFSFIGSAVFGGAAGEVRASYDALADLTSVFADLDGDAVADMEILLVGNIPLTQAEFLF